jgi:hypothetical protein
MAEHFGYLLYKEITLMTSQMLVFIWTNSSIVFL